MDSPPAYSSTSKLVPISRSNKRNSGFKGLHGYFQISNGPRVWDITAGSTSDGSTIGLYSPKPLHSATNQVFFIDWDGHLNSEFGKKITVKGDLLILSSAKPATTAPSSSNFPFPTFVLDPLGILLVKFQFDFSNFGPVTAESTEWAVRYLPKAVEDVEPSLGESLLSVGFEGINRFFGAKSNPTYTKPPPVPVASTSTLSPTSSPKEQSEEEGDDSSAEPFRELRIFPLPTNWRETFPLLDSDSEIKFYKWKCLPVARQSNSQDSLLAARNTTPPIVTHGIRSSTSTSNSLKPLRTAISAIPAAILSTPLSTPAGPASPTSRWSTMLSFPMQQVRSRSTSDTSDSIDRDLPLPPPIDHDDDDDDDEIEEIEETFVPKSLGDFSDAAVLNSVDADLVTKLEEMNAEVTAEVAKRASLEAAAKRLSLEAEAKAASVESESKEEHAKEEKELQVDLPAASVEPLESLPQKEEGKKSKEVQVETETEATVESQAVVETEEEKVAIASSE